MPEDEHIIEALGRSRVIIKDGKVVEVGDPIITECPLAKRFALPVTTINPESVKANIEFRIASFGMCTKDRKVISNDDFVTFGASEIISRGIESGLIDAAILVCDGAGTVIVKTPQLVQGIGGRMSGLVKTAPIKEVIRSIQSHGGVVLSQSSAKINQKEGVAMAYHLGFRRVAVTVADTETAENIKKTFPDAIIVVVHTTGFTENDAKRLIAVADLVTSCASKYVREIVGKAAIIQVGASIPVFAMTGKGKELVVEQILKTNQKLIVKIEKLPYSDGKDPKPLV